jgi:hypothetical protein
MGRFNSHDGLPDCDAGLGPLDIILACRDSKMGLAAMYGADDLVQFAAQTQKK